MTDDNTATERDRVTVDPALLDRPYCLINANVRSDPFEKGNEMNLSETEAANWKTRRDGQSSKYIY